MAVNFYLKKDQLAEIDIETTFGLRVMSVRGLEPPQPKELYTRDWAAEHGVDHYIEPYVQNVSGRKRKHSEILMTVWIEDDALKTAITKYREFCDYLFDGAFIYRDTLQNMIAGTTEIGIIYNGNKPSWYQFVGRGQVMAEITFINTSGAVTLYVAP